MSPCPRRCCCWNSFIKHIKPVVMHGMLEPLRSYMSDKKKPIVSLIVSSRDRNIIWPGPNPFRSQYLITGLVDECVENIVTSFLPVVVVVTLQHSSSSSWPHGINKIVPHSELDVSQKHCLLNGCLQRDMTWLVDNWKLKWDCYRPSQTSSVEDVIVVVVREKLRVVQEFLSIATVVMVVM